jgi:hypothetical protein
VITQALQFPAAKRCLQCIEAPSLIDARYINQAFILLCSSYSITVFGNFNGENSSNIGIKLSFQYRNFWECFGTLYGFETILFCLNP